MLSRAASAARSLLQPGSSRLTRVAQAGAGTALGLCVVGGAQGLYLAGQYDPLPEARGPLHGVALYLRSRVGGSRVTEIAPERSSSTSSTAAAPAVTLRRALSSGFAASPREEAAGGGSGGGARRKNILFVGDSLVTGVGCSEDAGAKGAPLARFVAEFLARALRVDVQWTAIGETGADIYGLKALLPAVGEEVRKAQGKGGSIDCVVVVCGLNDFKRAYTSLRHTASGFRSELRCSQLP